jgi:NADH-quinone oxidoreductase subunit K
MMVAPYSHVLLLAILLFLTGAVCAVTRRNLIMILIGVEVMLNAAGLVLVGASLHWQKLDGQIFFLFVLAVAASEVAIGLALFVYSYRRTKSMDADKYDLMKG